MNIEDTSNPNFGVTLAEIGNGITEHLSTSEHKHYVVNEPEVNFSMQIRLTRLLIL